MPSPAQVSDFPYTNQVSVSTLVDDKRVVSQIIELAKDEDDPPVIFGWDDRGLEEFWNKSVAYGMTAHALVPPNEINGGAHLVGDANGMAIHSLKIWILEYLRAQVNPPPPVVGQTACLACSQNQFAGINVHLAFMVNHPWFAAVLANGNPLANTLGSVWHPRPRVASGLCDQIIFPNNLWE